MTKKDYVLIANALLGSSPAFNSKLRDQYTYTVDMIADALASENPRFDRVKFLAACGVQS